jgi:hypothetical protein
MLNAENIRRVGTRAHAIVNKWLPNAGEPEKKALLVDLILFSYAVYKLTQLQQEQERFEQACEEIDKTFQDIEKEREKHEDTRGS